MKNDLFSKTKNTWGEKWPCLPFFFFQVFLIFGSSKEGWILIYSEFNLF